MSPAVEGGVKQVAQQEGEQAEFIVSDSSGVGGRVGAW